MFASLSGHVARVRPSFGFDVILGSNGYPDGVAAAALAAMFRVPLVQNVIGSDVNVLSSRLGLRAQIRWALRRGARVIAVSSALGRGVEAIGVDKERIVIQHNGVDGDRFVIRDQKQARSHVGLGGRRGPVILFVGNMVRAKGPDRLVEAMTLLVKRHPDALLCLVGSGDLDVELGRRVKALALEGAVKTLGRIAHDEIPWWMSAADVLCLPSEMEGCPNVVLEALACGRPVVATRVGGVPELISHQENGVLVSSRSPSALAEGLLAALERPWEAHELRSSAPHLSHAEVAAVYERALREARGA
jgi:glycosyltransferase involved in cell wall biosynthesis